MKDKIKDSLPEYLHELVENTPSSRLKLLAAWDGLTVETQIQTLKSGINISDELKCKILSTKNAYVQYLMLRSLCLTDNERVSMLAELGESNNFLVKPYCSHPEWGSMDWASENPKDFFAMPYEEQLVFMDYAFNAGSFIEHDIFGYGYKFTKLLSFALENMYSYWLMSDDEGYPSIYGVIIFGIKDGAIVAKMKDAEDLIIPKDDPIYSIIIAASERVEADFTAAERKKLSQSTLLTSYAIKNLDTHDKDAGKLTREHVIDWSTNHIFEAQLAKLAQEYLQKLKPVVQKHVASQYCDASGWGWYDTNKGYINDLNAFFDVIVRFPKSAYLAQTIISYFPICEGVDARSKLEEILLKINKYYLEEFFKLRSDDKRDNFVELNDFRKKIFFNTALDRELRCAAALIYLELDTEELLRIKNENDDEVFKKLSGCLDLEPKHKNHLTVFRCVYNSYSDKWDGCIDAISREELYAKKYPIDDKEEINFLYKEFQKICRKADFSGYDCCLMMSKLPHKTFFKQHPYVLVLTPSDLYYWNGASMTKSAIDEKIFEQLKKIMGCANESPVSLSSYQILQVELLTGYHAPEFLPKNGNYPCERTILDNLEQRLTNEINRRWDSLRKLIIIATIILAVVILFFR